MIYYVPLRVLAVIRPSLSGLEAVGSSTRPLGSKGLLSGLETRPCNVRGNVFLAVEGCLNAVFGGMVGHGKSPCFSRLSFLTAAGVDAGVLVFTVADGVVFHE